MTASELAGIEDDILVDLLDELSRTGSDPALHDDLWDERERRFRAEASEYEYLAH